MIDVDIMSQQKYKHGTDWQCGGYHPYLTVDKCIITIHNTIYINFYIIIVNLTLIPKYYKTITLIELFKKKSSTVYLTESLN